MARRVRKGWIVLLAAVPSVALAATAPDSPPSSQEGEPIPPVSAPDLPKPPALPTPLPDPTTPIQSIPQPGSTPASATLQTPTAPAQKTTLPPTPGAKTPVTITPGPTLPTLNPEKVDVKAEWGIYIPDTRIIQAKGNVVLHYQNVVLTSDEMTANLRTRDVEMKGNVVIQGEGRTVRGDALTYNLRSRTWKIGTGGAALLPPRMISPLFVSGKDISGAQRLIKGGPASITTCDLPFPHYHIEGRHVTIIPDRHAIIRGASFFWGRHKLFTLRRFVIPLEPDRYNIVPEVGQNNIEGTYVKTAYHYAAGHGQTGTARLDLMSKRGVGVGLDQGYRLGSKGTGQIALYSIVAGASALSGKELSGSLKHTQRLGSRFILNLQSDYRSNSYLYAPNSTTLSNALSLVRNTTNSTSVFNYHTNRNSSSTGTSEQDTYSLNHTQRWKTTTAQVGIDLFNSNAASFIDRELNTQFQVSHTLPSFDIGLNYNKRDLLESSNPSFFTTLDRLPELTLTTNRHRVKGGLLSYLPGSFGLSLGEYHEDPGNVDSVRVLLDLGMDNRTYRFGTTRLDVNGSFKQMVYDKDAAQYAVNGNVNYRIPFSRHNEMAWRYLYLGTKGYTPFRFDAIGKYDLLTTDFVHRERSFQFAVGTGRDFRGGDFAWNDVRVRAKYTPSKNFEFGASSSYDLNNGDWRDVINEVRYKFGQGLLNLGTRYTPLSGKLGTLRWNLFTPISRKWSIQTYGSWNGFAKRYDYRVLRVNWEHHDFQASLSYVEQIDYRTEKGFRFMVHLRAFPFQEQTAVGQFGQALDTTEVGEIY